MIFCYAPQLARRCASRPTDMAAMPPAIAYANLLTISINFFSFCEKIEILITNTSYILKNHYFEF